MILFQKAAENLAKEYQCYLDYLEDNEVELSSRTGHIGKKDCFALNQRFHIVAEQYQKPGRTQDYYVVIDFFNFFSIRSGILRVMKKKGKGLTFQRSQRYHLFSQIPILEQYILMMSVWLGQYQEALSESFSSFLSGRTIFESMEDAEAGAPLSRLDERRPPAIWGMFYIPAIRLYALFQLIRIEWLAENVVDKENKFHVKDFYLTAEGNFFSKLMRKQDEMFWYSLSIERVIAVFQDVTGNGMEGLEERLMHFWVPSVETGLHAIEFKIVIGSCVRKIKIGDQFTLDDLHFLIQKSVDFDMDHLYYFQIGSGTTKRMYFSPECDEPWTGDTVLLGELSFYEGMQFDYVFDFGDEWRFQIIVEHILTEHMEECEISNVKGEAPEQYESEW